MDTNPPKSFRLGSVRGPYRRHSLAFKRAVVELALQPGASVARIAREHDLNTNQVFGWRRAYQDGLLDEPGIPPRSPTSGISAMGGVGDSKGILESGMRDKHIKWICNAKVTKVEAGKMYVTEHDDMGAEKKQHELPFNYSMMLPAFKGVDAVYGIEGLTNPRGFITVDKHQRNQKYKNIFAVGVCVAIPPVESTPIPVGTPKTGYMIEPMVTATVHNIHADLAGISADREATWNAVCLADFGESGVVFVAMPQIPPRVQRQTRL